MLSLYNIVFFLSYSLFCYKYRNLYKMHLFFVWCVGLSVRPSLFTVKIAPLAQGALASQKKVLFSLAFTWSYCWSSSYQYIKELFSLYIFTWVCVCIFIIVTTTLMLFLIRWITLHIFIRCLNISLITFIFHLVFFFFQLSSLIYLFYKMHLKLLFCWLFSIYTNKYPGTSTHILSSNSFSFNLVAVNSLCWNSRNFLLHFQFSYSLNVL